MREIKFRGLRTDGKGWVYGDYWIGANGKSYIKYKEDYGENDGSFVLIDEEVLTESVGQLTGLTDKNGIDIYEGDKLHRHFGINWIVIFDKSRWIAGDSVLYLTAKQFIECEVNGNIHQNKELI